MTFKSYNSFHLGDNLIHLHFLRALGLRYPEHDFVHAVEKCHVNQLDWVFLDMENCHLEEIERRPESELGRNVWKNAGGYWEQHRYRFQWVPFYLEWFRMLAQEMGLESPFREPEDLLLNYPDLLLHTTWGRPPYYGLDELPDVLVVNSQPNSGQWRAFDRPNYMDSLIRDLAQHHRVITTQKTDIPGVLCTRDYGYEGAGGLNLSEIGRLSLTIPCHVMISTGPMWPTFNVWSVRSVRCRIVLADHGETLAGLVPNLHECRTLDQAAGVLRAGGWLP